MKYIKDTIVPCTHTACLQKDCPNHVKDYVKGSFYFPDCLNNPTRLMNKNAQK